MGRHSSISINSLFIGSSVPISSDEIEHRRKKVESQLMDEDLLVPELDEDEETKWDAVSYGVCSWDEEQELLNAGVELEKDTELSEAVVNETSEHLPCKSEVIVENESIQPLELSLCPEFEGLNRHLQNTQSAKILQKIFNKHGDITKGSMLKSVEAKTVLLYLVVEAVEVLKAHDMDSIGAHQMKIIQKWTDDAAAVGFDMEWLQKRIKEINAIFKYKEQLTRYNEISEQISAAKRALEEMEDQQMVLMKEVDLMKGEMDRDGFSLSNFCDGLI